MRPKHLYNLLVKTIPAKLPVCITGRPGIGKTDIVRQACKMFDIELMICHPAVDDPIDYKGLPGIVGNLAEFLPYGNLRAMIEADQPLVVFFDDLGQAPEAVQKALMQLLLSRSINGKKISDHVRFIAATNRKEDKAGVFGLLEPVKSRFVIIVELEVYNDDWREWALNNEIHPAVIAFAEYRPNLLQEYKPTKDMTNSPCPRTLANLSKIVALELDREIRLEAYQGAIGHAAIEYLAFEKMASELIPPKQILAQPHATPLPPREQPDVCYATAIGLAAAVSHDTQPNLMQYLARFNKAGILEYAALCVKAIIARDETLCHNQQFAIWASQNKNIIL